MPRSRRVGAGGSRGWEEGAHRLGERKRDDLDVVVHHGRSTRGIRQAREGFARRESRQRQGAQHSLVSSVRPRNPDDADRERVSSSAVNFRSWSPRRHNHFARGRRISFSLVLSLTRTIPNSGTNSQVRPHRLSSRDVVSSRPTGTGLMFSSLDSRRATTTTLPAEPTTTRVLRTTTATKTVHTTTRTITVLPTIPPPVDMALTLPPSRECSRSELGRDIFSSVTMALLFQHLARSRSVTCQGPKLKTPDAIRRDSNPCPPPLRPPLIDESSDAAREDSSRRPGVLSRENATTLAFHVFYLEQSNPETTS